MTTDNKPIISPDVPPEILASMPEYTIHTSDGPWRIKAANVLQALDLAEDKISTILHTDNRTVTILNGRIKITTAKKRGV
jgi:hypothetical protein